jgi:hypothetical protein
LKFELLAAVNASPLTIVSWKQVPNAPKAQCSQKMMTPTLVVLSDFVFNLFDVVSLVSISRGI